MEYTVHFQKGHRVGARSLRLVQVNAESVKQAAVLAKKDFADWRSAGYRLTRVDHYDEAEQRTIIDW